MATVNINKNLVHMHKNGKTGEEFASVSIPPKYKGAPWGSFTVSTDKLAEADDTHYTLTVDAEKTYVSFGMGDERKLFGYGPEKLAARLTPRKKAAVAEA